MIIDLSKPADCIPHDLMRAKVDADAFIRETEGLHLLIF